MTCSLSPIQPRSASKESAPTNSVSNPTTIESLPDRIPRTDGYEPKPPVARVAVRSTVWASTTNDAGCLREVAVSATRLTCHPLAAAAAMGLSP